MTATTTTKTTVSPAELDKKYRNRWPHPGYDLFVHKDGSAGAGSDPAWIVRCNEHGTLVGSTNVKDADVAGRRAGRELWCAGCKKAAKAPAKSAGKKAPTTMAKK